MRKLSLVAIPLVFLACGGPSEPPATATGTVVATEPAAPFSLTASQQQGRVIFESMCWMCHGNAGRGDGPAVQAKAVPAPPSFQTPAYAAASVQELETRFAATVSGADPTHPHMQYVVSLLKPDRFEAALSFIPALSYPPEIPGSALAGQRLFEFRCSGCHGVTGHGDGTAAASLVLMAPADFTKDTLIAAKNWDGVFKRIREGGRSVHGSSMPTWGVVLSEQETWDLVAFLATFQPGVLSRPDWAR
jgi:cytochrome c oxidase cbb3-type subunit II